MISARMFLPPKQCGLIIDKGYDFPQKFINTLKNYGEEMIWFRNRPDKTTRALNIYSGSKIGEGHQSFKYLSNRINLFPNDLILNPSTPFINENENNLPEYIHLVCNIERAKLIINEIKNINLKEINKINNKIWNPKLIWEPMPSSCISSEIENILEIISNFLIFSPNLIELQSILGITSSSSNNSKNNPTKKDVENSIKILINLFSKKYENTNIPCIIIRSGELGSYTFSKNWKGWIPPYYDFNKQYKVIDTTGGGNSFLGGLAAGLLISNDDMRIASIYAATAASFTIEQRGLPSLSKSPDGERWNDDDVWRRLRELASRVEKVNSDQP
nr:uncharacterized protein I206_00457 [Kwoniella pini CBS 10737]OCF53156.1 hypothetical protein I206_00457 [Kwoniella pini CBS 10737]